MADWVCGRCSSMNHSQAQACAKCGSAPSTGSPARSSLAFASGAAAGSENHQVLAPPIQEPVLSVRPGGVLGGLVGGVIGAVVATTIWFGVVVLTSWQVGLVAVVVGWLVGGGVVLGSRRTVTMPLVLASAALTIVALGLSEYLILYHVVTTELGWEFDLIQPLDIVIDIVVGSVSAEPMTLLFWAFALFEGVRIPVRAMRGHE
jgi:hypothetical protein